MNLKKYFANISYETLYLPKESAEIINLIPYGDRTISDVLQEFILGSHLVEIVGMNYSLLLYNEDIGNFITRFDDSNKKFLESEKEFIEQHLSSILQWNLVGSDFLI